MGVRDEEIKRLVKYAEGLGLRVVFSNQHRPQVVADWTLDNSTITIYTKRNTSKIETVLSLIHELGHAQHNVWERDRQLDEKLSDVLAVIEDYEKQGKPAPKKYRQVLLKHEIESAAYWDAIYKETNMSFPIWRLNAQRDYDIWVYQYYVDNGKDPSKADRRTTWKELRSKYYG